MVEWRMIAGVGQPSSARVTERVEVALAPQRIGYDNLRVNQVRADHFSRVGARRPRPAPQCRQQLAP